MPSSTSMPKLSVQRRCSSWGSACARRGAQPQARQIVIGLLEHRADHRRHVDEDRGPVLGDGARTFRSGVERFCEHDPRVDHVSDLGGGNARLFEGGARASENVLENAGSPV